jgi:hypothetical protein
VYFKDYPAETEWLPISPTPDGTSGLGFYCLHIVLTNEHNPPFAQTVYVNRQGNCTSSTAAATDARSSSETKPANVVAHRLGSSVSDDESRSYNLYNMFKGACDLLKLSSSCSSLTEDGPWDWSNVSANIDDLTAVDPPPASYNWKAVNPPYVAQDNETNVSGSLAYTFTYSYGESYATATQEGFKVGATYTYEAKIAPNKFSVSTEFNFSNTNTTTTGTTESTSISTSVATQPDGWTYLYGFDGEAETGFHYAGDLTLENTAGEAQPLKTPVTANVGGSPATLQPCVGYLAGTSNVSGSAEDLDAQAIADGYVPSDLNLGPDEREFLEGAPLFNTLDIKPCPGFTDDYRSGFGFDGSGTESALALGGTSPPSGNPWFADLGSVTTCAYFYPNDGELNNSSVGDSPCQKASTGSGAAQHRQVDDLRRLHGHTEVMTNTCELFDRGHQRVVVHRRAPRLEWSTQPGRLRSRQRAAVLVLERSRQGRRDVRRWAGQRHRARQTVRAI